MAEPYSYRDRGLGDDRRHSIHKQTSGGDDLDDVKRVRRRYDDDGRKTGSRYDGGSRRSLSPRDGVYREVRRESRHDEYRYSRGDRIPRSNSSPQREERNGRDRSPTDAPDSRPGHRIRDRSPSTSSTRHHHRPSHHHHHHHHHHARHRSSTHSTRTPNELPLGARPLVRSDFEAFKPLFAQYLEVQKRKDIAALDEREIKGRWKSFVGKWNRGELAEGWYHPETLDEARKGGAGVRGAGAGADRENAVSVTPPPPQPPRLSGRGREGSNGASDPVRSELEEKRHKEDDDNDDNDDEEDEYGPTLPHDHKSDATRSSKHGPGIPNRQDLALRRETAAEERAQRIEDLRLARKADRAEQRARLDEMAPRADPGTRERRLEKRREANDRMRGFRERSPGGEVGEEELIGGGGADDAVAEYRRERAAAERRRTDRELRREEEERARRAEREERVREYRRREEGTMEVLRRIARERFGGADG